MSILKLFSRNGNSTKVETESSNENDVPYDHRFEELFKDEVAPAEEQRKVTNTFVQFMNSNFSKYGYNLGYEFHDSQTLDNGLKKISAEFRYLLAGIIEDKEQEIYSLEISDMQTTGLSDNLTRQLGLRIEKLRTIIEKCRSEIELSENYRGYIEFPANSFREGFEKGMNQYFKEEFFGKSTGLFS